MTEHVRVFDPDEKCPFEDCNHHRRCAAAWKHEADLYVPLIDLEHELGKSGASHTDATGGKAFAVCNEWKAKMVKELVE